MTITNQTSPYVFLICNDLSPQRATVIRICESGDEARCAMATGLMMQPSLRAEGVQLGDRIWRTV